MARLMTRKLSRNDCVANGDRRTLQLQIVPVNRSALRALACGADNETMHPSPQAAGS